MICLRDVCPRAKRPVARGDWTPKGQGILRTAAVTPRFTCVPAQASGVSI